MAALKEKISSIKTSQKMEALGDSLVKCKDQLTFEPTQTILHMAKSKGLEITSADFATMLDEKDELKAFRREFHYPKMKDLPKGTLQT